MKSSDILNKVKLIVILIAANFIGDRLWTANHTIIQSLAYSVIIGLVVSIVYWAIRNNKGMTNQSTG